MSWLEEAIASAKEKKRIQKESVEWHEAVERRKQAARAKAQKALSGPTVEIPEALLEALLDIYHGDGWAHSSESDKIVSTYLEDDR